MRKLTITLLVLLTIVAGALAAAEELPPILERWPVMVDGEYALSFSEGARIAVLSERAPITGFAFGPGRLEVAFCAPAAEEGRAGLWTVGAWLTEQEKRLAEHRPQPGDDDGRLYRTPPTPPRLVWTAPEGVALRGPVWWSPNGAQIAVRAFTGEQGALMSVDYATGEAVKLTEGAITAAAWSPDGKRIAYARQADGLGAVWLQAFPPGEARKLGEGEINLHWSVDGRTLSWIAPRSGDTWTRQTWEAETGKISAGEVPARPEGTEWSPDGRFCAVVEGEKGKQQLVIYPANSAAGETVPLEGVHPQRVLGWTPDSHLVVILADRNLPIAVAALPEAALSAKVKRVLAKEQVPYPRARGSVVGPPLHPEAGAPSWSSSTDMLAYVYAQADSQELFRWQRPGQWKERKQSLRPGMLPEIKQALVAVSVARQHVPDEEPKPQKVEANPLRDEVLSNVKNVAIALNAYLSDWDAFPEALTGEELREIIRDYIRDDSIFCLPDSDEVVVQYLIPPGATMGDFDDAARAPMVVVADVVPGWDLVGFVDGHAKAYPTGAANEWRQYILPPKE